MTITFGRKKFREEKLELIKFLQECIFRKMIFWSPTLFGRRFFTYPHKTRGFKGDRLARASERAPYTLLMTMALARLVSSSVLARLTLLRLTRAQGSSLARLLLFVVLLLFRRIMHVAKPRCKRCLVGALGPILKKRSGGA
jgi:hypothetical protein